MKITNMEQVKENVGKKVVFQFRTMCNKVTGVIVYGTTKDCEGDIIGDENGYYVVYDNVADDGCTCCSIQPSYFLKHYIVTLEIIE